MAAVASAVPKELPAAAAAQPAKPAALIKSLTDHLTAVPSSYVFPSAAEASADPEDSLPIIDYSKLVSGDPNERSGALGDLSKACRDWGFFMVTNHGVPEGLRAGIVEACEAFFNLTAEEKKAYQAKRMLSPINAGTSFNRADEKAICWRDFLNLHLHPKLHYPDNPPQFREAITEWSRATREIGLAFLRAISETLGLPADRLEKASEQEQGFSLFTANLYPPCPQPELAMGISAHTDDGLLNFLVQNGVAGLQLQRDGRWYNVDAPPGCYLVIVGDHIEIMSNGKYKSSVHRGTVNSKATRMTVVVSVSPAMEAEIAPIPELVEEASNPAAYRGMKYGEYLKVVHSEVSQGDVLSIVRIPKSEA